MKLTLGPVLFNWRPEDWCDFYARIADEAAVDRVCVGEVVCSKRAPFFERHLPTVAERLARAGKEVVLSGLALVSTEREQRLTRELAETEEYVVEANDATALRSLAGRPHGLGPFVNVYNEATLAFLAARGAAWACLPPELPQESVGRIAAARRDVEIEVWGFGRTPLAISARCYHARLHKLTKDGCQFVCEKDPDGLPVKTVDGRGFLSANGVQTLSHTYASALVDLPALAELGVASCRLSPQAVDMVAVARAFRDVADGRRDAGSAHAEIEALSPVPLSNGFLHGAPGHALVRPSPGGSPAIA
jgi:collagenase-like PrtC family protease